MNGKFDRMAIASKLLRDLAGSDVSYGYLQPIEGTFSLCHRPG